MKQAARICYSTRLLSNFSDHPCQLESGSESYEEFLKKISTEDVNIEEPWAQVRLAIHLFKQADACFASPEFRRAIDMLTRKDSLALQKAPSSRAEGDRWNIC